MKKDCPICHGRGYKTIVKAYYQWRNPPIPESTTQICVCRFRTGLTKEQVKILRKMK